MRTCAKGVTNDGRCTISSVHLKKGGHYYTVNQKRQCIRFFQDAQVGLFANRMLLQFPA